MSVEAFKGARAVKEQYFKDRQALLAAEGAVVKEPWTVTLPAIPEQNVPASIISGVCHKVVRGGLHFGKNNHGVQYFCTREGKYFRPMANRVPFMVGAQKQIDLLNTKRSHLCGELFCINPDHMHLELQSTSLNRLSCAGPAMGCTHKPPCLLPGRYYKARSQCNERKISSYLKESNQEIVEEESDVCEVPSDVDDSDDELVSTDDDEIGDKNSAAPAASHPLAQEVIDHTRAWSGDKVSARIKKAEADLDRAQKMGNVELEVGYIRRLCLLLDLEKEERSTAAPKRGLAENLCLDDRSKDAPSGKGRKHLREEGARAMQQINNKKKTNTSFLGGDGALR